MEIRPARPVEYEAIGDLVVAAYRRVPGEPQWYLEHLRDTAARAAHTTVIVALDDDNQVIGTVTYVPGPGTPFSDVEREDEAGMRALAVAEGVTRRGLGRALVQAVVDRARADGRRGVALVTRPAMTTAQRLYATMGFVRSPEQDDQFAPGEWLLAYRVRW